MVGEMKEPVSKRVIAMLSDSEESNSQGWVKRSFNRFTPSG